MAINDVEHCETCEIHEDKIKQVSEHMPDEDELYDLAELFKIFGDSTRIRILYVLFESEVCVCDLAEMLHMNQSAISHQLKILKQAKLVTHWQMNMCARSSIREENILKNKKMEEWIMKKKFKLEDLDCANCAAKMEDAIKKIPGVNDASVSFMTQKMSIDAEDAKFDEIMKEVVAVCAKVEPDCKILF